jgi:putative ABC transport system substrate-binding protein
VQLLRDLAPKTARVGFLVNPDNLNAGVELNDVKDGAAKLGVQLVVHNARNAGEIDAAFGELARARIDALIVATDPVMLDRRQQVAALAERGGLPAISFTRQLAMAGLLLSYGPDIGWMYRQAGGQVARILKGAKPADIPVMHSVRFELVLNVNTARRLGLVVPPAFLSSVDEVVE